MVKYDNPMKPVVQRVREILLAADKRLEEVVKWQSPTFVYKGNLASFNPRSKKHASLMFHTGASRAGATSIYRFNLLDELNISIIPVLLGDGTPLSGR